MSEPASLADVDIDELLLVNGVLYKISAVTDHERGGFRVSATTVPYVPNIPPGTPPHEAQAIHQRATRRRVANFRITENDTLTWVYGADGARALKRESHLPAIKERRKQAWAELKSQMLKQPPTLHNCTVCGIMHTRDGRVFNDADSSTPASS